MRKCMVNVWEQENVSRLLKIAYKKIIHKTRNCFEP